ncbi:MAG: hypothetical protein AAFV77_11505, partial [Planctomycetota bacterium]
MALDLTGNGYLTQSGDGIFPTTLTTDGIWMLVGFQFKTDTADDADLISFQEPGDTGDLLRIRADLDGTDQLFLSTRMNGGGTNTIGGVASEITIGEWHVAAARIALDDTIPDRTDQWFYFDDASVFTSVDIDRGTPPLDFGIFDEFRLGDDDNGPIMACVAVGTGDPSGFLAHVHAGGDPTAYAFGSGPGEDSTATLIALYTMDRTTVETFSGSHPEAQNTVDASYSDWA